MRIEPFAGVKRDQRCQNGCMSRLIATGDRVRVHLTFASDSIDARCLANGVYRHQHLNRIHKRNRTVDYQ